MQVISPGYGRTGTLSLKVGLERLLQAPCFHMVDLASTPESLDWWTSVPSNVDWRQVFDGYEAIAGWPAAFFYNDLVAAFPEAKVILSSRDSNSWWTSAWFTIFKAMNRRGSGSFPRMWRAIAPVSFQYPITRNGAIAEFERHNSTINSDLVWTVSDGWNPLATLLNVEIPDEPFPYLNKREEFFTKRQLE